MKKFFLSIFILLSVILAATACGNKRTHLSAPTNKIKLQTQKPAKSIHYYSLISKKQWYVTNGKEKIFGYLYQPQDVHGKLKTAILSHGLNGNYQEMEPYAENLAHHGYLAYAFDFPGGSFEKRSTSRKTTQMSLFSEENDLLAIMKAIYTLHQAQHKKILLVGGSQGGAVSALAASRHPQHVAALALMYPAFSITADAQAAFKNYSYVPKTVDLMGFKVGRIYFKHLLNMDLTKAATKFTGPVLIVHGKKDPVVPIHYSRVAARNFKKANLKTLPHAGHDFTGKNRKKAISYLDQFIKKLN